MDGLLKILLVDDDEGDRKLILRAMKQAGLSCDVVEAPSTTDAIAACERQDFDCAIVDYRMPGQDGLKAIPVFHRQFPFMAVVMATGQGDEKVAASAMKRGALDYITKDKINPNSIKRTIKSALQKAKLRRKITQQQEDLQRHASQLADEVKALAVETKLAKTDQLTGLPARALFIEAAAALRTESAKNNLAIATLFIDLDGFKSINDRLGHSHGDAVLVQTAQILRSSIRALDLAGRFGGDEFVVCLAATIASVDEIATQVAKRIIRNVEELGNGIGCSIGIALVNANTDAAEIDSSIRLADEAMYECKKHGKNQFIVRSELNLTPS